MPKAAAVVTEVVSIAEKADRKARRKGYKDAKEAAEQLEEAIRIKEGRKEQDAAAAAAKKYDDLTEELKRAEQKLLDELSQRAHSQRTNNS